jgi:hypothetical protein
VSKALGTDKKNLGRIRIPNPYFRIRICQKLLNPPNQNLECQIIAITGISGFLSKLLQPAFRVWSFMYCRDD